MVIRVLVVGLVVLGVATGVLNAISYFPTQYYTIVFPPEKPGWGRQPMELSIYKGSFYVDFYEYSGIGRSPKPGWREYGVINDPNFSETIWHNGHIIKSRPNFSGSPRFNKRISLTYISLLSFGLLLVLEILRRRRRHLLAQRGYCLSCRYDLTGNVSGVCSECGTEILPEQRDRVAQRQPSGSGKT